MKTPVVLAAVVEFVANLSIAQKQIAPTTQIIRTPIKTESIAASRLGACRRRGDVLGLDDETSHDKNDGAPAEALRQHSNKDRNTTAAVPWDRRASSAPPMPEIGEQRRIGDHKRPASAALRRTRPRAASGSASPRSSASPRTIVLRAMPVIRATAVTPVQLPAPRPPQTGVARARPAQDRAPHTAA